MTYPKIFTAPQLARHLFPNRNIITAFRQSRNTDDGLVVVFPEKPTKRNGMSVERQEYFTDAWLAKKLNAVECTCGRLTFQTQKDGLGNPTEPKDEEHFVFVFLLPIEAFDRKGR